MANATWVALVAVLGGCAYVVPELDARGTRGDAGTEHVETLGRDSGTDGGGTEASPDAAVTDAAVPDAVVADTPAPDAEAPDAHAPDAACVGTAWDPANCGACGHACSTDQACNAGTCVAAPLSAHATCADATDVSAGGTFVGTTCGAPVGLTSCGPRSPLVVYRYHASGTARLALWPQTATVGFVEETRSVCDPPTALSCGGGGGVASDGTTWWWIAVQSQYPGACGPYVLVVTPLA